VMSFLLLNCLPWIITVVYPEEALNCVYPSRSGS
jgi:hypothetical protein